eukprot:TRINITY_DN2255_c0_g1_i2.p1 TRINITY_DN2255_c0_g1~~TRINITY_DN2255_c0_g1_i2.p1  ORF type:complete len:286 (-),score=13.15 TRINITY_DN2255_c0_g1_i2:328-1185(-)
MFAIFDRIHSPSLPGGPPPSALERSSIDDVVRADLVRVHDSLPAAGIAVNYVTERLLDGAAFGTIQQHARVSWAEHRADDGARVFVVLFGAIDNEAEIRELYCLPPPAAATATGGKEEFTSTSAQLLTELYWKGFSDADGDYSSQPQTCLASLEGAWAFCLYDDSSHYVLAARRDDQGTAPLYWTSVSDADLLLCTWRLSHAQVAAAPASGTDSPPPPPPGLPCREFPSGCFYEKKWDETIGSLHSFADGAEAMEDVALPMPCAAMFRVSSGSDLAGLKPGGFGM